jgi:hypothetical protein
VQVCSRAAHQIPPQSQAAGNINGTNVHIENSDSERKQNSEPVRAHQFNSPTNSNLPAPAAEKPQPAAISLENIRHERAKDEARR